VLRITLELAHEGREGKPVGALFAIGDHREVEKVSQEGRINPFHGYTEKERNILDDSIKETVKEIAKLDGAFIVKGNGVIVSACATLRPAIAGERLPQGLGSRHAAAAAVTASTRSIAITLSESTGDVRVWRRGTMITEIEKAPRALLDGTAPPPVT
jgi:DNA integrity scanning protein DisA with diadenylate cyclase activity